jgi:hypothetical protein
MSTTKSTLTLAEQVWAIPGVPRQIIAYTALGRNSIRRATLSKFTFEQFVKAHGHTIDLHRYHELTDKRIHLVRTYTIRWRKTV